MISFDAILGMDLLSLYGAAIDCVSKVVSFPSEVTGGDVIVGSGTSLDLPFISCIEASKLLYKGCIGFLSSVLDTYRGDVLDIDSIDVVREFPVVFADDVPGLPPDRELEFGIDLVPNTSPISKDPYRMAPTEMKELKDHLQGLLDKGLIRPSSSP